MRADGTVKGALRQYLIDVETEDGLVPAIVEASSEHVGQPLVLDGAWVLRYEPGCFIGLHNDYAACRFTALASVGDAQAPPSTVCPSLVDSDRLLWHAERDRHPPGVAVAVPRLPGLVLIEGSCVPHHRPPARARFDVLAICMRDRRQAGRGRG